MYTRESYDDNDNDNRVSLSESLDRLVKNWKITATMTAAS